jgi:hypothetical protein
MRNFDGYKMAINGLVSLKTRVSGLGWLADGCELFW